MKLDSKVKAVKKEKSYGTLYLNSKDCPFIKDATIGDEVEMTITLKIKELRAPDHWDISEKGMKPTDVITSGNIVNISKKEKKNDTK